MHSRFNDMPLSSQEESRAAAVSARIEDYLDHVSAGLLALPYPQRSEIRGELRQHITALAAAHEEMGSAPEAAVEAALSRFGDPARIARGFVQAWRAPSPQERAATSWPAIRYALLCFGGAAAFLHLQWIGMTHGLDDPQGILWQVSFWAVPVIAGWKTGAAVSDRAGLGAFYALAALSLASLPLALLNPRDVPQILVMLTPVFAFWMPLGCLSASLSSAVARKRGAWRFRRV